MVLEINEDKTKFMIWGNRQSQHTLRAFRGDGKEKAF